jgi:hypothetical protein
VPYRVDRDVEIEIVGVNVGIVISVVGRLVSSILVSAENVVLVLVDIDGVVVVVVVVLVDIDGVDVVVIVVTNEVVVVLG